jgi:hypothetical protein
MCWASSTVPPFWRNTVMPVARNVWLQMVSGNPRVLALPLIIAGRSRLLQKFKSSEASPGSCGNSSVGRIAGRSRLLQGTRRGRQTPTVHLALTGIGPRRCGWRCWDALVRAGVCARPTHRTLGERFFRRMLDNPADRAILSTSVDTNTTFVWRTCSHPDLPMPAYARCDIVDEDRVGVYLGVARGASDIVDEDRVGVYHCIARCVRRAFLCGTDSYTGRDYSHRKAWVLDRLRQLAGLFGVEVCDYAIMSNHLHIVLRNRPDVARQWSDDEVAIRSGCSSKRPVARDRSRGPRRVARDGGFREGRRPKPLLSKDVD